MAEDNPELEAVVARIRQESPHLFHTAETLPLRRFIDEPRPGTPHAGYIGISFGAHIPKG